MQKAIDTDGLDPIQRLLTRMQQSTGSAELDFALAKLIYPKRTVVLVDGEPIFWDDASGRQGAWSPVPRFTRAIDAAFEWENIVRVEKMAEGRRRFWRARQYPLMDGDGRTEATARRVAAFADWLTNKMAGPERLLPRTALPEGVKRPTVFPKGYGYRRPSIDRHDRFTMQPYQHESDPVLIIQILLDHIRQLRWQLADQAKETNEAVPPPADASRGTYGYRKKAIRRLEAVRRSVVDKQGPLNMLLSDVTKAWLLENRPRVKNKERMLRSVRRFIEFHGDRPIDGYSKSEVREFCNALFDCPKYIPHEIKPLPLPSILEYFRDQPNVQRITIKTLSSYQKDLQAIFNWAFLRDMCSANPAAGLIFIDKRLQSERRVGFDQDDLRRIFVESPLYAGCRSSTNRTEPGEFVFRDSLFWFGLVGLFTGARLSELAKSVVDDYRQHDDIDFLDIHARRNDPHLKTLSADRQIPIHPMLKRLGFLNWVEDRRRRGKELVFEEMFGRKNPSHSNWSHTWMTYQRGIGITDPRKVFHSFRHTFKGACRAAEIQEEVHDTITGHRPFFAGRGYGGPVPLNVTYAAIKKIRYPGLDLTHLYDRGKLAMRTVIDEASPPRIRHKKASATKETKAPKFEELMFAR